jgi:transcriptional regulator with AAA-type ATPase domain
VDTANVRPLRNVVERINAIEISEEDLKSNEEWLRLTAKERHRLLKELVNQEDEQRRPSHSVILSNAKYLYNGTHYAAVPTRDIEPTPTKTESAKNES